MSNWKPNLSNVRLVELPTREVETPPTVAPDPGAIFLMELERILQEAREAGLSDRAMQNIITAFVPDFPMPLPKRRKYKL